jgi:hypothetical protein
MTQPIRAAVRGGLLTMLSLFGGLLLGLAAGLLIFGLLPGADMEHPSPLHITLGALPALLGFVCGSAWWGASMARLGKSNASPRRLALAGALGFAPITLVLGTALGTLEPLIVAGVGGQLPIHRIFTLLFVPSAFLIAGVSAASLGLAVGGLRLGLTWFWQVGLAAALAFLAVNLVMEALGWVVGAPGAAERATMLTVMTAGNLAAALAGGAVLGWQLQAAELAPVAHRAREAALGAGQP